MAPLNTQRRFFAFTHIAFQRETGIGFFELVSGWAGSPAEGALVVFFSVNCVFASAGTFGYSILARVNRNKDVCQWVSNHPNTGSGRIVAAIFWLGMRRGTDHLTCPASIAFINIDFNRPDDFLFFLAFRHPHLIRIISSLFNRSFLNNIFFYRNDPAVGKDPPLFEVLSYVIQTEFMQRLFSWDTVFIPPLEFVIVI